MTQQTQNRWKQRPAGSNWGDFGPDDQIGRMNLITPERRLAAIREVQEGKVFTLSLPLDYPGGEAPDAARRAPRLAPTVLDGKELWNHQIAPTDFCCDDNVAMSLQYSTQWDALFHWGRLYDDGSGEAKPTYYNGYRAGTDVVRDDGSGCPRAHKLGIENMAMTGAQGRGVLVNLVKPYGTGRTLIDYDMLMRAIDEQGVEIRPGDMLCLYTGYGDAIVAMGGKPDMEVLHRTGAALRGSDQRLLDWIDDSGISALIADNEAVEGFDMSAAPEDERGLLPLHDRCLFKLGIHLGEFWWLKELAEYLDAAGRHAFLLTAPPLRLPGAAGSPATPVATV